VRIAGRRIVVTGAASGIGRSIAAGLVASRGEVFAVDRDEERLRDLEGVVPIVADVAERAGNDEVFARFSETGNPIDVFVANAGLPLYGATGSPDWDRIDLLSRTNFVSVVYQLQKLMELNNGSEAIFVIIASGMSKLAVPGYAIYSGLKAALDRFVDAFRHEPYRGIRVCVVYPISTRTRFFETAAENPPIPPPVQSPEHVARCVLRGIRHRRRVVYPSPLLRVMLLINRVVPFAGWLYQRFTRRQLLRWLDAATPALRHRDRE
jgi:short-subunit dehydrogenase